MRSSQIVWIKVDSLVYFSVHIFPLEIFGVDIIPFATVSSIVDSFGFGLYT